jgi:thiol-disulfide isomerase/thioredoxin
MAHEEPVPTTGRLARWVPDGGRAEDRGEIDGADAIWPVEAEFSLAPATGWLNSPPLDAAELRGRVVLVNFWTYTCINWLRSLPYLRAWADAYRESGLVVVGVHSPEFSFEHDVDNVRSAVSARSIRYPVVLDNHFLVWRSFHNHFWPAIYIADATGRIRHHNFGEGGYEETEEIVRELLVESGVDVPRSVSGAVTAVGVEAAADWDALRSGETYLGYDRTAGLASGDLLPDLPQQYAVPERLRPGHWALSGTWVVGREASWLQEAGGGLACRFEARDAHLVVAPAESGRPVPFRLRLDGARPGADHGVDVDADGLGTVSEPRLYQLIRRRDAGTAATVDVEFSEPGVRVYAVTFG